jgi:UDP-N-acetylglucosamine 2-epimerase
MCYSKAAYTNKHMVITIIVENFEELWDNDSVYQKMTRMRTLYGDRKPAERIIDALLRWKTNEFKVSEKTSYGVFAMISMD